MKYIKKIGVGLFAFALAAGASMLAQIQTSTYAANTLTGVNEVITIADTTDGQPPDASITPMDYSGDGNIILFSSLASNLQNAGSTKGLYTYNIKTGTTKRVNKSTNGTLANGSLFLSSFLSETGRYVSFGSMATNLIDGTTSPVGMYYKHDTQTGTTSLIGGYYGNGWSQNLDRNLGISNDGRFSLLASRYKANNYPNHYGIVIGEDVSGTYNWNSLGIDGNSGLNSANSKAVNGSLSCDGSFAAFQINNDIRLSDLRRGTVATVTAGGSSSTSPIISCNGRYVLYATTNRTDITPTPSGMNAYLHLVRYDRITGERMYIDSNSTGTFSTTNLSYDNMYEPPANIFNASIADTGDVVFIYNNVTYLKHLSDGSGTLESVRKAIGGAYVNAYGGEITSDGRYIFFQADPYTLGIGSSPAGNQIIRTKTGL